MELIADLLPAGTLNVVNGFGLEAGKPLASVCRDRDTSDGRAELERKRGYTKSSVGAQPHRPQKLTGELPVAPDPEFRESGVRSVLSSKAGRKPSCDSASASSYFVSSRT